MTSQPLAGRRVLVTRAAHQAGKLSDALRALGAIPVEVPVLEIGPPASFGPLNAGLNSLSTYDLLIFTSANAVRALAARAAELGMPRGSLDGVRAAAIGEATALAARDEGFQITLIPESYVAESLVEALRGQAGGKRFLLVRAALARDVIPDALRAAGAQVDVVDAYRNVMPEAAPEQLRHALAAGIDAVTFTSSSSVTHLRAAAHAADLAWPFAGMSAVSIGPITSATLRESGWEPAIEAEQSDIPGLVAALVGLIGRL